MASAAYLYPMVGKELVPDDDQGEFNINVRLPRGTSYPRTEEFIKPIEKEILALPYLSRVQQQVGAGQSNFNITMTPLEERERLAAGHDAPGARHAAQVPGGLARAGQHLRRHRHLRRLDHAAAAATTRAAAAGVAVAATG